MPSRAATFANVTAYNSRPLAGRDYRRTVLGSAVLGLGSVSAVAVMAGTVAVAAAWMVSGSLNSNPDFRSSAPVALESVGLPRPPRRLADPTDMLGGALASANPAYASAPIREAELAPAAVAPSPARPDLPPSRPRQIAALTDNVPLPAPRPLALAPIQAERDIARAPARAYTPPATIEAHRSPVETPRLAERARNNMPNQRETRKAERLAALAPAPSRPPLTTGSIGGTASSAAPRLPAGPRLAYNNPETLPGRDSHAAIYDIVAHTVYMPDGERLEAHSGLGRMLDDPLYVSQKGRGPTPPNTYDLTLRRGSFHGVQAL
ncbi:MAG: tlde1 domain-containing protein, partial [Xanthobacteraceae bacterium]